MKTTKLTISVFSVFLFIFMSDNSFCQIPKSCIKAGITFPGIKSVVTLPENEPGSVDPYSDKSNVTGISIFASYDLLSNNFLILSGEAGFVQKGFKYKTESRNGNGEITGSGSVKNIFSYADLSSSIKIILRKKIISPYVSITPVMGFFFGNSSTVTGNNDTANLNSNKLIFDNLNSFTFGIKIGVGAEIDRIIKNIPLIMECRYNPDLTDAYNKNNLSLKNQILEFNIGIKF